MVIFSYSTRCRLLRGGLVLTGICLIGEQYIRNTFTFQNIHYLTLKVFLARLFSIVFKNWIMSILL